MSRLIIFRNSPPAFSSLVTAARAEEYPVIDIFDAGSITRLVVDSKEEGLIELRGSALLPEDRVLFLGPPAPPNAWQMSEVDRAYCTEEWRVALLSALAVRRRPFFAPMINSYLLSAKPSQIQKLAAMGWLVPDTRYIFDPASSITERIPSPDTQTKAFLIITPLRVIPYPQTPYSWEMTGWLGNAIKRTQDFLVTNFWPWVTVPIAMTNRGVAAYGMNWYLPPTLSHAEMKDLLSDIWQILGDS